MNKLVALFIVWYQSCKQFNVCHICEHEKFCENFSSVLENMEEK